ncbi:MAG TPA: murein transglycosylase A [Thermoanaerobaculia bacterium]|nr:murein transglycosylase A [Thermoanaerobaculia bacterium]
MTGYSRSRDGVWRTVAVVALVWAVAATSVAIREWRRHRPPAVVEEPAEPLPDRRELRPVSFDELPGWLEDDHAAAVPALLRTCARFSFLGAAAEVRPIELGGTVADWLPVCGEVPSLRGSSAAEVRAFLERRFRVFSVANRDQPVGLFTGYYEPLLRGSRTRSPRYTVPLHRQPPDLVSVELGDFREDLAGRRLAGRLDGKRLRPYDDRRAIVEGAIDRQRLEVVWVDDPIAAFFLQIQGSGQIELDDGTRLRLGYAGQNGHEYFAIGRALIERGEIPREEISLQSIRAWLRSHPEEAEDVMSLNRSYVFFRVLEGEGPIGSLGVALTPGRSLAVDRRFLPLGAPVWLDATAPDPAGPGELPLRRLLVAQDTGGAIRGPVRGDVFWGAGEEAEEVAGRMKSEGRLYLMLPAELAARLAAAVPETEVTKETAE